MARVFGEKYYEADQSEDEADIEAERDIDLKLMKDEEIGDQDSEARSGRKNSLK